MTTHTTAATGLTDDQLRATLAEAIRREDSENWTDDLRTGDRFSENSTVATVLADAAFTAVKPELDRLRAEIARLRDENAELQEDSDLLGRLQAVGVDNWEGYELAFEDD